jgi:hypothetical protein
LPRDFSAVNRGPLDALVFPALIVLIIAIIYYLFIA